MSGAVAGTPRVAAHRRPPAHRDLLEALGDPHTYGGACAEVERHETHGSWVFVSETRALKVKKPLRLAFLDYSTRERRGLMCREEVRLNRRLAPDIYLGTVGIVLGRDGVTFDAQDDAFAAAEVGVLMRRYDEADTLAARLAAGRATGAELRAVGARLARFHAEQTCPSEGASAFAALRDAVRATLDDLDAAELIDADRVRSLRSALEAALSARRSELLERGRRGLVVDGHGDLRCEHVLLTDPIQVVDALEFDRSLRVADVACDLAFLLMELEAHGGAELGDALIDGYRDAGGDPGDEALLGLMACYRALVRVKVAVVRAAQGDASAAGDASALLEHALRLAWRARGPQLLALCGAPATGKSTIAHALSAASGMVHVSSDRVRKARAALAPTDRAPAALYSPATTLGTYRAVGEHAAAAFAGGRGAVIDATMGDKRARAELLAGLGRAAPHLRYVECRVPAAEARRRAAARERDPRRESDADAGVAARLTAAWEPLGEVDPARHLMLRTDRPAAAVVEEIGDWLNRAP